MELISLILLCIIVFLASIMGAMIGGSFLIVIPAMIFFGMGVHEAIGTSKLFMIAIGLSAIIYYKNKRIDLKPSVLFIVPLIIGVIIGSFIVVQIPENILKTVIGICMIVIAVIILFEKRIGIEDKKIIFTKTRKFLTLMAALVIGVYSGFYGAASSIFIIMAYILLIGSTFIEAVGYARIMDIIEGIVGLTVFTSLGAVNFAVGIPTAVASLFGGFVGAKIALKAGDVWLRRTLFIITIIMSVKLLFF